MRRVSSGYTLVEIIIVLAVTGALLMTSVLFISNSEGQNRFSQSMRDTQSKIQDWLNDIPTGVSNGTGGASGEYHCYYHHPKTLIDTGAATPGDLDENNGGCIFLGKAIQFTDKNSPPVTGQESQIFSYSIFGTRSVTASGDTRNVVNLVEANPFAATGTGNCANCSGSAILTEVFKIPGHARVKAIQHSSGVFSDKSHLAGFYLSFNQQSADSSGSANIRGYQYPLTANQQPADTSPGNKVNRCLNLRNAGAGANCDQTVGVPDDQWPPPLTNWQICFDNKANDNTALITVSSNNGLSISTKLEFIPC